MAAHSFLPPSGAATWSRCALWPTMNARYPQEDTQESIEGTAAHWVVSERIAGRNVTEGQLAPNGIVITDEMLEGAELVHDTVIARFKGHPAHPHVEERVSITDIHPDCFGTPDIWSFHYGDGHLEIIDYKFGHGFVDEYFNLQGLLYALGAINALVPRLPGDIENVTVSFTIVQPRCYYRGQPVRTHTYRMLEARTHLLQLVAAAQAATLPQPTSTTNPECDHCPGRHACSALQKAAYSDAEYADDRQPVDLSPQAASLELRMLERALSRLEARVDGLRELTLANIKAGKQIPHYKAEPGRPRANWNVPVEQVIAIGQMLGKNLAKSSVVTPNQAKKLGIDEAVISAYSVITSGSIKLLPHSDDYARKVFGSNQE